MVKQFPEDCSLVKDEESSFKWWFEFDQQFSGRNRHLIILNLDCGRVLSNIISTLVEIL